MCRSCRVPRQLVTGFACSLKSHHGDKVCRSFDSSANSIRTAYGHLYKQCCHMRQWTPWRGMPATCQSIRQPTVLGWVNVNESPIVSDDKASPRVVWGPQRTQRWVIVSFIFLFLLCHFNEVPQHLWESNARKTPILFALVLALCVIPQQHFGQINKTNCGRSIQLNMLSWCFRVKRWLR